MTTKEEIGKMTKDDIIDMIVENKFPLETYLIVDESEKYPNSEIEFWPGDVFEISQAVAKEIRDELLEQKKNSYYWRITYAEDDFIKYKLMK